MRGADQHFGKHVQEIETAVFARKWDFVSWARIRRVGSLPIFTASSATLIFIVVAVGLARWYNAAVSRLIGLAASQPTSSMVSGLPTIVPPAHFASLILAILALAIASVVYDWRCPDVPKEYSETRWTRELTRTPLQYRAANWSRWRARYVCLLGYGLGGGYTLWYLGRRIWDALDYIWSF